MVLDHLPVTEKPRNRFANSVVISFRVPTAYWHRIEEIIERSPTGYENVGDYMRHLLRTQAFRKR